jgi:hypothetical protein
MELKYFPLGTSENNRIVKIFRVIFGVACTGVAVYWLIFNINSLKTDGTLWITIIFLTGFGLFQVWSGIGRATRFIEIGPGKIRLKKNSVLSAIEISAGEIEKIEIYPLNVIFFLKSKKRIMLRFGTTFHDINETIKEEVLYFSESNTIPSEIIREEI